MVPVFICLVVISSAWVFFDAKQIGARRGLVRGNADLEPLEWYFGCLLLWIVAFPFYLIRRPALKRAVAEIEDLKPGAGFRRTWGPDTGIVVGLSILALGVTQVLSWKAPVAPPPESLLSRGREGAQGREVRGDRAVARDRDVSSAAAAGGAGGSGSGHGGISGQGGVSRAAGLEQAGRPGPENRAGGESPDSQDQPDGPDQADRADSRDIRGSQLPRDPIALVTPSPTVGLLFPGTSLPQPVPLDALLSASLAKAWSRRDAADVVRLCRLANERDQLAILHAFSGARAWAQERVAYEQKLHRAEQAYAKRLQKAKQLLDPALSRLRQDPTATAAPPPVVLQEILGHLDKLREVPCPSDRLTDDVTSLTQALTRLQDLCTSRPAASPTRTAVEDAADAVDQAFTRLNDKLTTKPAGAG